MPTSARCVGMRIRRNRLQIHNIVLPGRCGHRPLQFIEVFFKHLDKLKFAAKFPFMPQGNKKCRPEAACFWSRVRESNPPSRLGKPLYYRYTNPAGTAGIISKQAGKFNPFLSKALWISLSLRGADRRRGNPYFFFLENGFSRLLRRLRMTDNDLDYLTAMASISHRTFLGRVFTATQLRAGLDTKYLA